MRHRIIVKGKCVTPECNEPAKTRGACGACYSGLRRLATQSIAYLSWYMWKCNRLHNRAGYAERKRNDWRKLRRKKKAA